MHAKSTVAAALLAATPLVSAGTAIVKNRCSFPVYVSSVSNYTPNENFVKPNKNWSEAYKTNPNGGGVSIKISRGENTYDGAITQLEYTVDSSLWYDMSNINGNPFMQWGMTLQPTSNGCRNVLCKAGVQECADAYNTPYQNEATASCTPESDLVLTLCSGQDNEDTPIASAANAIGDALNLDVANNHKNKHGNHSGKKHNKHNKHNKKPAPAPVPVPAPVPAPVSVAPQVSSVAGVAVTTTFVTQVVTVAAREASAAPEAHAHANYHRHHHFHHHS